MSAAWLWTLWLRVRMECQALFVWWRQEMQACGEVFLFRLAPQLLTRTVVGLESAGGHVSMVRGKERRELFSFACDTAGVWPTEIPEAALGVAIRGSRAIFTLAPEFALVHRFSLPDALERDLDRVIALQLEREQPLRPDRVCFDWRLVGRSRSERRLTVEVLLAHRGCIERVQALAQAWQVHPVVIGVADATGRSTANFVERTTRSGTSRLSRVEARLALAGAALATLCALTIGAQWIYERVQVGRTLAAAKREAAITDRLRREVESTAAPAAALTGLMRQTDALDVLTVLTERIPADSWVYELDIGAQDPIPPEAKVSAFTPTATLLVDLLRKSGNFDRVQLLSAVSAGLGSGDRLQLIARWAVKTKEPRATLMGVPVPEATSHERS